MSMNPSITDVATASVTTTDIPSGKRHDARRFEWTSGPLLLPAAALLIVLFLGPVVYSFYLGLTNLQLVGPHAQQYQFTGLDNLKQLIHDSVFFKSLLLTGIFVVGSGVVGATGVGLALALAMQRAVGFARLLVGAIVMLAFMLPPITAAVAWLASSQPDGTLTRLFFSPGSDFLNSMPMVIVCAANAWSCTGLAMLLFAAALRQIPADVVEAATLENSSSLQRFRHITLPLLRPTITTTVLLITLLTLANFTLIYLMTGGGPGTSTAILPVYSYQQAFSFNHLAYGALVGDVMVLIATVFSALYVRLSRDRV